jgi:hypothetical protein
MVSGTFSLSCSECFSPFPHGTCSLSVSWMYLALPDGPGYFRQDSSCPALLRILPVNNFCTCTGLSPSLTLLSRRFHFFVINVVIVLLPHNCRNNYGLGYFPFARHYSENHFCFLFLPVLRCFSSQGLLPTIAHWISRLHQDGLPHSDIPGSQVICTSPKLFAACHVLLRLQEPRHPPCALIYFL